MAGAFYENQSFATMEDTPLLSLPTTKEDESPRKMQSWPRPFVIVLCILGIWRPGTAQQATRQRPGSCRQPKPLSYPGGSVTRADSYQRSMGSNEAADSDNLTTECDNQSLNWSETADASQEKCHLLDHMYCDICNSDNNDVLRTNNPWSSAPDAKVKSCLIRVLMFLYLTSMCGLMSYDFAVYIIYGWGRQQSTLLLVSYFTYLFQVFVVPLFALFTQIVGFLRCSNSQGTWAALQNDYVFERVQYLKGSCAVSYVSFGLFLAWPTCNGVLRIIYDYTYRPHGDPHAVISLWCALVSYIMYGSFCYLIYIERRSFQNEFRVVAHFVAGNASKGVLFIDVCRDRLSAVYRQFRIMRDFVGIWMAFTMAVATWGITAHLTWNYVIFTYCDITNKAKGNHDVGLALLNLLIWSQKIMFFVLPSVAVGGLNVDYIWMEFRYIMAKHNRYSYSTFWGSIKSHMSEIKLFGKGLRATLVFSALGMYLGLKLSDDHSQNVAFWNGPGEYNLTLFCHM